MNLNKYYITGLISKLKNILIISPHFPPINAPDMQRIRMCLPFYKEFNWNPIVITVKPEFIEGFIDNLLTETYPNNIKIHKVDAFPTEKTRKFGIGSLSMRSFFQILKKGNELLRKEKFDMIFFSTTAFHVLRLGPYWKKKFGVPFVVDIQDPWRNDYYLNKPSNEHPPKFKINYLIDKHLEKATIPKADGIISVSEGYIEIFKKRYPEISSDKYLLLPFCYSLIDFELARKIKNKFSNFIFIDPDYFNILYIGRGGFDLHVALEIIFEAYKNLRNSNPDKHKKVRFIFAGTSYAPSGKGLKTILPIAEKFGIDDVVFEYTDRLPYFESLSLLQKADLIFIPGSNDSSYTASKIFPYILSKKPILAIFHKKSSVVSFINNSKSGVVLEFDDFTNREIIVEKTENYLKNFIERNIKDFQYSTSYMENFSAKFNTKKQTDFFNKIIENVPKNKFHNI